MQLPAKLSRYAAVATLFMKHHAVMDDVCGDDAEELAKDLEKLGPTFIKLGQVLSGRTDLLPAPYVDALSRLQDDVKPFSFAEVERVVEAELGTRILEGVRNVRGGADGRGVARAGPSRRRCAMDAWSR